MCLVVCFDVLFFQKSVLYANKLFFFVSKSKHSDCATICVLVGLWWVWMYVCWLHVSCVFKLVSLTLFCFILHLHATRICFLNESLWNSLPNHVMCGWKLIAGLDLKLETRFHLHTERKQFDAKRYSIVKLNTNRCNSHNWMHAKHHSNNQQNISHVKNRKHKQANHATARK